jgi:ATPase subunit of ABC transporter with duplicated ATPase domains
LHYISTDGDVKQAVGSYDPVLDPAGPNFDVRKWTIAVLRAAEGANIKLRRASVTFKNLNVSGSGIAMNLQPTVASYLFAPVHLHEWLRLAKKPQRKIITRFEGIVKPGEMLLVLGRPGSGCSTLLKTLAGELHGLKVGSDSTIHYSGMFHPFSGICSSSLTVEQEYLNAR